MREQLQVRYMNILRKQVEEGLDILEKMNVGSKNYQQVVVNINNANNISFQLEVEIENQRKIAQQEAENAKVEAEKQAAETAKIMKKLNKESQTPKRKYTKKAN